MTTSDQVKRILAESSTILLDFDGPVCSIFAGVTDVAVADRLREVLDGASIPMDETTRRTNDPLAVLHYALRAGREVLTKAEDALVTAEIEAVASATPTPLAAQFIRAMAHQGRSIAIVSNNSTEAIATYLDVHELASYVAVIVGRRRERPELMKPNPFPIKEALRRLGSDPASAVLIGDSAADIGAARAAHVRCIGYGNDEQRLECLQDADGLARSIAELLAAL